MLPWVAGNLASHVHGESMVINIDRALIMFEVVHGKR
jgi:hypothetical protein